MVALAFAACGDGASGAPPAPACEPGAERCECYGNGTCNEGLECRSGLCVNTSAAGGAEGSGGADRGGAGGKAGTESGGTISGSEGGSADAVGGEGTEPNGGTSNSGAPATGGVSPSGGEGTEPSGGTGEPTGGQASGDEVCGDGTQEGAEACDDGNLDDGDGCSAVCEVEPQCPNAEGCEAVCGDGFVALDEACDDGNLDEADGCSALCEVEGGYTCGAVDCDGTACRIEIPTTFRDFNPAGVADGHPDFEPTITNQVAITGLVAATLSEDDKPAFTGLAGGNIQSGTSFDQWYRDTPAVNTTIQSSIVLFGDATSRSFVNRYGDNGEQWKGFPGVLTPTGTLGRVAYCSNIGCDDAPCLEVPAGEECFFPCEPWGSVGAGQACLATVQYYDGDPVFFPIDAAPNALPGTRYSALIPPEYGSNWGADPGGALHDFYFTTELKLWLEYDEGNPAYLEVLGDDDLWVFVNGQLALDLGGWHTPLGGTVTIDSSTAAGFGLEPGQRYQIAVFHAERARDGSTLYLRFSGIDASSRCVETP